MRKYRTAAAIGAALIIWVSVFQGYRKPLDLTIFAAIGAVAGAALSFLPRFVTWTVVGAMIPAVFVPIQLPAEANWNELESLHAFSFCIIGAIAGLLVGLTVRKDARWYQLSLRTLLLLFTLAAICFSPFGRAVVTGRIQQAAVRELQVKGASVSYSAGGSPLIELFFGRDVVQQVTAITWNGDVPIRVGNSATYLNGQPVTDVQILLSFPEIESLELAGSRITDLHIIAQLSKLKHLDLRGVSADVAPLKNLMGLRTLDLRGAAVDPDAVKQLRVDLPNCEILLR